MMPKARTHSRPRVASSRTVPDAVLPRWSTSWTRSPAAISSSVIIGTPCRLVWSSGPAADAPGGRLGGLQLVVGGGRAGVGAVVDPPRDDRVGGVGQRHHCRA